jgi:hypothetical protein
MEHTAGIEVLTVSSIHGTSNRFQRQSETSKQFEAVIAMGFAAWAVSVQLSELKE